MPVTIKQIADMAGVSRGTVDKVLNKRPGVKKETREKVLQIAKELNYKPNFLGKALVQSQTPIKIGIILTPEHNQFIKDLHKGVDRGIEEFGVFGIEAIVKNTASLETDEQLFILDELEQAGIDGLALFPINHQRVKDKVNQMIENGTAVLTCNSKTENINDFCFLGQDHYKGGQTAAGLMMKLLPQGGNVGVILSSHQLSCHDDRLSGFESRLKECHSDINIIGVQENQDRNDLASEITKDYLTQTPDLDGLYITGGGIDGVGKAVHSFNDSTHCKIIGHDLTEISSKLLHDHTVDFIIDQNPEEQGYQIVKIMFEYLVKKIKPDKFFEIPIEIMIDESI